MYVQHMGLCILTHASYSLFIPLKILILIHSHSQLYMLTGHINTCMGTHIHIDKASFPHDTYIGYPHVYRWPICIWVVYTLMGQPINISAKSLYRKEHTANKQSNILIEQSKSLLCISLDYNILIGTMLHNQDHSKLISCLLS